MISSPFNSVVRHDIHHVLGIPGTAHSSTCPTTFTALLGWAARPQISRVLLHTIAGTAHYMAQEVILGHYWSNCDEWSCGIIAYLLLSVYPPFLGRDRLDIFKSILRGKYSFRPKRWGNISKAATDFIARLLIKDSKRMTAAQALADPWLSESGR